MKPADPDLTHPYLVVQTKVRDKPVSHDYSSFANRLGPNFVEKICALAKHEFAMAQSKGYTTEYCVEAYVSHLQLVFTTIESVLNKKNIATANAMEIADWNEFTTRLISRIESDQTKSDVRKKQLKSRYLGTLTRYAKAGLIPMRFDPKVLSKDGPHHVLQTTPWKGGNAVTYDYTDIADIIGRDFLESACTLVKNLRQTAGVEERTWLANYASRFDHFIRSLHAFFVEEGYVSAQALSEEDWRLFVERLGNLILADQISDRTGDLLSPKTKDRHRLCTNNLMAHMAVAGLLPKKFEIVSPKGRKRAASGTANVTRKADPDEGAEAVSLSPFAFLIEKHKRKMPYDYGTFQPLARYFLLRAIPILYRLYGAGSEALAKDYHHVFTSLLLFLEQHKQSGFEAEFFSTLATDEYTSLDSTRWEKMLYEWRDHLINSSTAKHVLDITKHMKIQAMNRLWAALADSLLVPAVKLKGIKGAKSTLKTKNRPSLAQLSSAKTALLDESAIELHAATHKISQYFDESDKEEAREFINALCANLPPAKVRALTLDALVVEIARLNANRLEAIRRCAEKDFLHWLEHWNKGQHALAKASHSPEEMVDLLDRPERSVSERSRNRTRLISGKTDCHLGNALNLLIGALGGNANGISGRYHHIKRQWGGNEALHAYLHPHKRATVALWTIILIDTGANCEVVREMPHACLRKAEDPNHMIVSFGLKARAGYKRINDCLPIQPQPGHELSAVQAIQHYEIMSSRNRKIANGEVAELLFLDTRQNDIIGITEFRARDDFKEFLQDHAELRDLPIRPSFIRPSYLLKVQHEDPAVSTESAQAIADHVLSSTTGNNYTHRTHTKLVYVQKVREFTRLFQSVIIASIEGAAEKLGISPEEAEALFSDAARSGLGIACLNPKAGVQPGTRRGESCTRLDACPNCEMRYLVGTVDNITDLILFEEYLKSQEAEATKAHPEAWETRWLPWLALAEVALAKFALGDTASAFLQATEKANARRPTYRPFKLF
ncbi:hypothetical protein ACL58G_21775 [Massilia sp. GER05]|uniref:hypothetical protein n=1 Tax=Massilia sp. GER05 TaxID=3394605 RepID=UPI003F85564E